MCLLSGSVALNTHVLWSHTQKDTLGISAMSICVPATYVLWDCDIKDNWRIIRYLSLPPPKKLIVFSFISQRARILGGFYYLLIFYNHVNGKVNMPPCTILTTFYGHIKNHPWPPVFPVTTSDLSNVMLRASQNYSILRTPSRVSTLLDASSYRSNVMLTAFHGPSVTETRSTIPRSC